MGQKSHVPPNISRLMFLFVFTTVCQTPYEILVYNPFHSNNHSVATKAKLSISTQHAPSPN